MNLNKATAEEYYNMWFWFLPKRSPEGLNVVHWIISCLWSNTLLIRSSLWKYKCKWINEKWRRKGSHHCESCLVRKIQYCTIALIKSHMASKPLNSFSCLLSNSISCTCSSSSPRSHCNTFHWLACFLGPWLSHSLLETLYIIFWRNL